MARPRRSFSPEFKLRVIQEVEQGQSQAAVARKYDLSPHLIPLWKKALSTCPLGERLPAALRSPIFCRISRSKPRSFRSRHSRSIS
ncbi:MAG: transposase [bacterium]|nr:transposase [bacterium]